MHFETGINQSWFKNKLVDLYQFWVDYPFEQDSLAKKMFFLQPR